MSDDNNNTPNQQPHKGSMGTDRTPPSGTDTAKLTDEERLKKRIEELRRRDPFIYR